MLVPLPVISKHNCSGMLSHASECAQVYLNSAVRPNGVDQVGKGSDTCC